MKKNILHKKFNYLTVEKFLGNLPVGNQGKRRGKWLCTCTCGNKVEVFTGALTSGNTKSCGCLGKIKDGKKKCTFCKNFLSLDAFYDKASRCIECDKKRRKELYDAERVSKSYYNNLTEESKEKRRIYAKKLRDKDTKKANAKVREWRKNNPNYKKERLKNDLNFRLTENLRSRLYKALKGFSKSKSTKELIGCSIEELKIHIESQFTKGMTWENYGKWHIDHIKPCSLFNLTLKEEQEKCFHFTNLQPLWEEDNLRKSNKYE